MALMLLLLYGSMGGLASVLLSAFLRPLLPSTLRPDVIADRLTWRDLVEVASHLGAGAGVAALYWLSWGFAALVSLPWWQRGLVFGLACWFALAVPVLLGSLGRIPLGILTDARGGRVVFIGVMLCSVVPAVLIGWVTEYWQLLACGFLIGVALASFAVGVGFVNGWYPPQRQGTALGVYGAGNIGQSLAAFAAPVLAVSLGLAWGFWASSPQPSTSVRRSSALRRGPE